MPRIKYTADGGHYRVAGYGFDPGDVKDVDEETAEYLADHDDFERLDDVEELPKPEDLTVDEDEDEAGDEFDADAFLNRTPVEDVADDIRAGEADGHLDEIATSADRTTVSDAIGERRAELEG